MTDHRRELRALAHLVTAACLLFLAALKLKGLL